MIYPKPYSIYLSGTVDVWHSQDWFSPHERPVDANQDVVPGSRLSSYVLGLGAWSLGFLGLWV